MPSITLTKQNSVAYDTYVAEANPSSNYATSMTALIGTDSNGKKYRYFLFFDLGLIPNDAIINSATLNLYQQAGSAGRTLALHAITQSWAASGPTWNAQPAFDATPSATYGTNNAVGNNAIGIKNIVQDWVNGNRVNYGLLIKDVDESTANTARNISTLDHGTTGQQPTLTIDYTIPSTGKKQVEYVGANPYTVYDTPVPFPSGAQPGDLIVLLLHGGAQVTLPDWVRQATYGSTSVFTKFMIAGETSVNVGSSVHGRTLAFRNVKSVANKSFINITSSTSFAPPPLSVTADKTAYVLIPMTGDYQRTFKQPLSYASLLDIGGNGFASRVSMKYMHTDRLQSSSAMASVADLAASGLATAIALEPFTNNPPTLTLTNPADNLSLTEGSTYTIAGTASDPDVGNAVTVKYAINGGTARNITSAVSDGSTPIPFSKTLTFQNGRLYDGGTDVSGPLAENTTYTLSVWAVDDPGGTSTSYTRTFTVILNRPPAINLDAYVANHTGVSELETLTFTGTLTDPENDTITLTAAFNGGAPVTIKSAVASGTTFTYSVPVSSLAQGSNTVVFTATDPKGASSTKTLTFTKSGTFTPVKTAVVRYAITPPLGTTAEMVAWVHREAGDLTVAAAHSIVASGANESFAAMTNSNSVPVGDGTIYEDQFVGTAAQPGAKVTLRLTLTRTDAISDKAVKKIMGGIG